MNELDHIRISFSGQNLLLLNLILALVLFGIALELKKSDFTALLKNKKSALAALFSHFVLLPVITFSLVMVIQPSASVALGMILVAACPGGNISNYFTHLAKGNTALAVSITSISHMLAVIFTPLNFSFYGNHYPPAADLLKEISLSPFEVLQTVSLIVVLPLTAGILFSQQRPLWARRIMPFMKGFSLLTLVLFIAAALAANVNVFWQTFPYILPLVAAHNALALSSGYVFAFLLKLPVADRRTIAFETGVQNSGLGLILIFSFFNGLGGMAVVAATWGIWHLISGSLLAYIWRRKTF